MGGKTKQSQRTKNNVRPSSSGRSALLLDNVKLTSGVMNAAGTDLPALFPSLAAPNIDPLLSPELQMCVKKLNKKDPITKTKALQELLELVGSSTVDDVVALLPSWAHFYRLLTADPDRKVRELTQACHASIVCKCGRRVAPQLKALMPAWLQAQHDEHAPAHTHAHASLTKTFPDSKLPEVIAFCKEEILTHLVDNITGAGEANFIRKSDSPEEREGQVSRLVSSSLHGLQHVVRHTPAALHAWLWERLQPLLNAPAFWKRANSTDATLRAAWYALVGALGARYGPQWGAAHGRRALRALLGAREAAPLPAAQLWDATLQYMDAVPEWHQHLDKPELFSKRILDVLESGGWGDARHLAAVVLPVLARLPPQLATKDFYQQYFRAMLDGLDKKTILSSKSERQAWITSLEECLRYLSIQSQDFIPEVVSSVHRAWLERVLSETHEGTLRANLIKHSAANMATLVKYWLKQAKEDDKYDQLIRNFWQNVGSTITAQIDKCSTEHAEIAKLIDGHILLVHTLKTCFVQEAKKQQSIKFDGDAPAAVEKPRPVIQCDAATVERYNHNVNSVVELVCAHYLEFAGQKQVSSPVLSPLITLLVEFNSAELVSGVSARLGCAGPYALYDTLVRGWLAGDSMRCKAAVDIVFLLLQHMNQQQEDALMDSFKQFPPAVVEWCLWVALSHPHSARAAVRRWLRGGLVAGTLRSAARRLAEGELRARDLLLACCTHDAQGELLVSSEAVSAVVSALGEALRSHSGSGALEACAALGARLASTMSGAERSLPRLVLALFQLSLTEPRGGRALSLDTWCEVRAAWQDGLCALPQQARARLTRHAAALLRDQLRLHEASLDLKRMEDIISLCPFLLCTDSEQDHAAILAFTRDMFADTLAPEPEEDTTAPLEVTSTLPKGEWGAVQSAVLRLMIVRGHINCPYEDKTLTKNITDDLSQTQEVSREELVSCLTNLCFRTVYLRTILLHKIDEELEDTCCNDLLADDYIAHEFSVVLRDYVVITVMYEAYAFWPHYLLIKETKERLETLINDVITECTVKTRSHLLNVLAEAAATKGYFWAFARRWLEVQANLDLTAQTIKEDSEKQTEINQECEDNSKESAEVKQENAELKQERAKNNAESAKASHENAKDSEISAESKQEVIKENAEQSETKKKAEDEIEAIDVENLQDIVTGCGFFHTLQANEYYPCASGRVRTRWLVMVRSVYAAYCGTPVLAGTFLRDVTAGQATADADVIVNAYYNHNHVMLYEQDVSRAPWSHVVCNAAVADYLSALVAARGWDLPPHHWDFATITLCNLLTAVLSSKAHWGATKVALLSRAVLHLLLAVEGFISGVRGGCLSREPAPHVAHLPTEWADIFAPDVNTNLLTLLEHVLEHSNDTSITANQIAVLDVLIACTRRLDWAAGGGARHAGGARGVAERAAGALATAGAPAYKYLAHQLLLRLHEPLVLEDAESLAAWSAAGEAEEEVEERARPANSLLVYARAHDTLQALVPTALQHVRVCENTCALEAGSDVAALALGWCLLADAAAAHHALARGDLRHHYTHTYREQKWVEPLLTSALRLLPGEVVARAQRHEAPPPAHHHLDMFARLPDLNVYKYCGGSEVAACACRALYWCVRGAGAADARGWRGAAHHRLARVLDNIVQAYITPHVVKEEFTQVQQRASEIEDTDVSVHWSTYEVDVVLTVEERPIELRIELSRSHPLGLPTLSAPDTSPVAGNTNWLVMYMGYQNGSVLNAIKMWVGAVTSRVERATQCFICYCRLHFSSGKLPSAHCRQCNNRFHTACLSKWFVTSNKSTCPMCRASF